MRTPVSVSGTWWLTWSQAVAGLIPGARLDCLTTQKASSAPQVTEVRIELCEVRDAETGERTQ